MTATGRVYDRGYRPYDGELGGQRAARAALWKASMRRALGLRRSWRQKLFPWLLLAIVSVPAIVNVGIAYLTRDTPASDFQFITYREYVGVSTALLVFVGITAPDILCPDRRNRTLPLLFARPLTGVDYVIAKVGAIFSIVFAFGFVPHVVLFVGQMLVSDAALEYLVDNADIVWKVPLSVAALAIYYSAIALAVSSFTTRRIIAAGSLLLLLLVSSVISGILMSGNDGEPSLWAIANLLALPLALRDVIFLGEAAADSPLSGIGGSSLLATTTYLVVLATSLGILVKRYRWIES